MNKKGKDAAKKVAKGMDEIGKKIKKAVKKPCK